MTNYAKPSDNAVNKIWSNTAPTENVQRPDDAYINLGWTQVKPPSEYFNWWMKKVDTLLAYANQKGIPEWDSTTEYQANKSFVQCENRLWLAVKTNTNSYPTDKGGTNGIWKDYLQGFATQVYTDNAVNTLKNSLHKVATTGLASDLQGYLPWAQLADVPQWIRETHTDNGQLYMRSPDGTQYRLGNGRLDFFNGARLIFSVNPDGLIDNGRLPVNQLEGIVPKSKGGTGRGDGNYDGQWFYANGGGLSDTGFILGSSLANKISTGEDNGTDLDHSANVNVDTWNGFGIRSSINNYITTWKHNARTGETQQRGDIILNGSSGERNIRCDSNWMRVGAPSATLRLGYGNLEFYNDGGKKFYIDGGGNSWQSGNFEAQFGKFNKQVEVKYGLEVYGDTPFIDFHYKNSNNDYTTRLIQDSDAMLSLYGGSFTIERDLWVRGGRLNGYWIKDSVGSAVFDQSSLTVTDIPYGRAYLPSIGTLRQCMDKLSWAWGKHAYDTTDAWAFSGDSNEIPTTKTLAAVRKSSQDQINQMAWAKDKWIFDTSDMWSFGGASNEIPTTRTLATVRNNLQTQISDRVTDLRFVRVLETGWSATLKYGANDGEVIGWVQADGTINNYGDYIGVFRLQFYKNGNWYTVPRVNA